MSSEGDLLAPGTTIAGRFQVDHTCEDGSLSAHDSETGAEVRVILVGSAELAQLEPLVGFHHAHLAQVLHVGADPVPVAVSEHIPGSSLEQLVASVGRKTRVDAVRFGLRMADAVTAAHRAGAIVGIISMRSVVAFPDHRDGPVLQLEPRSGASAPAPTEADDAHGITRLLGQMLLGADLPPGPTKISDFDEVEDPQLEEVLLHGLHADLDQRQMEMMRLKGELARWFVDHGNDESQSSMRSTTPPPPLPPSQASGALSATGGALNAVSRTTQPPPAPMRRGKIIFRAVGALLVGTCLAWGVMYFTSAGPVEIEVAPAAKAPATAPAATTKASAKAIDLSEVSVAGAQAEGIEGVAACVAGYLPKDTFSKPPDFSWLCAEQSAVKGTGKLRAEVVKAGSGGVTPAMKLMSRLGWYDLPAYAVIRGGCCEDAKPVRLPKSSEGCESLEKAMTDLAAATAHGRSTDKLVPEFEAAARCEVGKGTAGSYAKKKAPDGGEAAAYAEFLKPLQ